MELKEYVKIFKKNIRFFWFTVLVFVFIGWILYLNQSNDYKVTVPITIARVGIQETYDYKYDEFYRLQADERFADTLVNWLKSQWFHEKIKREAGEHAKKEKISLKPAKLSSQYLEISFLVENRKNAGEISKTVFDLAKTETERINSENGSNTWFKLVSNDVTVKSNAKSFKIFFFASLLLGIFVGFWTVFVRHYIAD